MAKALTTSDCEALSAMPENEWFTLMDRWSSRINRSQFRLDRLEKSGHLTRRVSGEYPDFVNHYRKTLGESDECNAQIRAGEPSLVPTLIKVVLGIIKR